MYMLDLTSCIQFSSILPKKAWVRLCKMSSDPAWIAWSGFGQTYLVLEASWSARTIGHRSSRMSPARYQFPTFKFGGILPQAAWIILYRTSPDLSWFWFWLTWLGTRIQSRSKPECKNHGTHFWPLLPSPSRWGVNQIRQVYWVSVIGVPFTM